MNGADTDLIKQIHEARKYNLDGLIIFDYAHLGDNYVETLTQSIFKQRGRDIVITESAGRKSSGAMLQFKTRGSRDGR